MTRLLLCRTCKQVADTGAGGAIDALADALQAAGLDTELTLGTVDCMGTCEQPVSLALQGHNRATLVFSGVQIPQDLADIIATAQTYLAAEDGWIEDGQPCGRLRFCLRARVPALAVSNSD